MEIERNTQNFANGSSVISVTTGDSDNAHPPTYSNIVATVTITPGADAAMPPGYPDAYPGAVIAP